MQAIRIHQFGDPSVMKLERISDPQAGPGQVVIGVRAAGVNPVEVYIRKGIYGTREFPFTPGGDCAGVIEAVGAGVKRLKLGMRVYTMATISGAYAEKAAAAETKTFELSDKLSFEEGAAVGTPYSTAYRALFDRAQAQPGEKVLVHGGSGGVGNAAIQLAKNHGMIVFATAGSVKGLELIKRMGADHALNHKEVGYLKKLMELTGDVGVEVILEMLANVNLGKDLAVLAKNGRVAVIGSRGRVEIDPRDTMSREADIRGVTVRNATDEQIAATHALLRVGFDRGLYKPVIGQKFSLADAAKAHEAVMQEGSYGKIVLIP
jgi:NADPH2:quinone reductase